MPSFGTYIRTFRLRTLPLSVSGVLLGGLLSVRPSGTPWHVLALALLVTVLLQILANVANDLGDWQHGTDTEERLGPMHAVQTGDMTVRDLRRLVVLLSILSAIAGLALVASSLGPLLSREGLAMVAVGAILIAAAIFYTVGPHPYGYVALGDLAVFVCFGLASCMCTAFLMEGHFSVLMLLPAAACGFLSVGVLNVNNMRDIDSDRGNRTTVPMLLGERGARIYHGLLLAAAVVCLSVYAAATHAPWYCYAFLIPALRLPGHMTSVWRLTGRDLDPQLPVLSVTTFLMCAVFAVAVAVSVLIG